MEIGVTVRNMGEQSTLDTLLGCARAAEAAGMESVWITDHIAIPPDDAEGSGGRYLDPLLTLGFLAGATSRIKLATGVLILPYRPALPTAKQVATLQELSAGRLLLGVGVGWMDAEFRALGLNRHHRGRDADATLEFLRRCFEDDLVTVNGQPFLFRPRPPRPPILIGGRAPHALVRAARYGDGWLPMGGEPAAIAAAGRDYARLCAEAGRSTGSISVMVGLPLTEPTRAAELLTGYAGAAAERVVVALRYDDPDGYRRALDQLREAVSLTEL